MCGIFCSIGNEENSQTINVNLYKLLQNRGPDSSNVFVKNNIVFGGFVLWQQGQSISVQPLCLKNWTLLLNGDIFNRCLENESAETSDTYWLIEKLCECKNEDEILKLFKYLKGPYSMVMYDSLNDNLYFARDPLGRNSLIIERDSKNIRILSNSFIEDLNSEKKCIELPPYGLFKIYVGNPQSIAVYPWTNLENSALNGLQELNQILPTTTIDKYIEPIWLVPSKNTNIYFDFYKLCNSTTGAENIYEHLLNNEVVNNAICEFLALLRKSVKERISFTPNYCTTCIKNLAPECHHSKIAILFSGGIDCTILSVIADEFVDKNDSIDLMNVAFEAPKSNKINWDVPDRCSAKESFQELKRLCPMRNWNLVEVNVTRNELNDKLQSHIKHLIYPLNTVLDESLGCAFWFASRGHGYCNDEFYKSTARVILIGSGADELFGGYTRHRNAYARCTGTHDEKLLNLSNELDMDFERLPSRNLGRDDRVIADNGKTSRAPFIQEDITHFVRSLKPEQRCCFTLEQGVGDKLFLRLSGYQLGLRTSVKLKKRAVQFGSRIANKNQNAKDFSTYIQ